LASEIDPICKGIGGHIHAAAGDAVGIHVARKAKDLKYTIAHASM
jgi:hypothetical protein